MQLSGQLRALLGIFNAQLTNTLLRRAEFASSQRCNSKRVQSDFSRRCVQLEQRRECPLPAGAGCKPAS